MSTAAAPRSNVLQHKPSISLQATKKRITTERTETTEKNTSAFLCELCGLCGESPLGLRLCRAVLLCACGG